MDPVYKYNRGKWKELVADIDSEESTPKKPSDDSIKNVHQKSIIELEELISRQEKILRNKVFLSRLKDKGKNILETNEKLKKVLEIAKQKEQIQKEQNGLLVKDVNSLEWNITSNGLTEELHTHKPRLSPQLDEDDDEDEEENPLQLLARHSVEYPVKNDTNCAMEDAAEMIQKELEKLEIEDAKEGARGKGRYSQARCQEEDENYFGKKLLQTLSQSGNEKTKKERFKTHLPLRCQSGVQDTASLSPSPAGTANPKANMEESDAKPAKMIPLEESLARMAHSHRNVHTTTKSCFSLSEPSHLPRLPSDHLNYRDTNVEQHLLDDQEEIDDWFRADHHYEDDD